MSLMLRLQIGAILMGTLTGSFVLYAAASVAPAPQVRLAATVFGSFIFWWVGSVAIRRLRDIADDTPNGWYHHTIRVFWFGNIATLVAIWLVLPFADEGLQLVTALFTLGPTVVEVMGTVRSPRSGPPGRAAAFAPIVIPAGMILFFAVHGGRWTWPVIGFIPALTGILLLLRLFLQRTLAEAEAAQFEAERERDARARFLASASHDLGQPLQSARLFLDRAMRDPKPLARAEAARSAQAALAAMERLLRQMLDHFRFEAGALTPNIRDTSIAGLLTRLIDQFAPLAEMAEVKLRLVRSSAHVSADPELLERAIGNLLDNALRHSAARRVLVGLTSRSGKARIWVIDDGTGVAGADRPGLFQEFVQGHWRGEGERGGFGIGLSSVQRYCSLMGGSAGFDARWRRGAAFFLELPLAQGLAR